MNEVLKTIEIKIQALLGSDIINKEKIMDLVEIYEKISNINSYKLYTYPTYTKSEIKTYC